MTRYNGWKNYQTWNVALWFDNDEGLYLARRAHGRFTAATAEAFTREVLPTGTPDLRDRVLPYKGVAWAEVARAWNGDDELEAYAAGCPECGAVQDCTPDCTRR